MPLERIGSATTWESAGRELHRALAEALCDHHRPYCADCYRLVEDLVKPVARMVTTAAMFERKNTSAAYVAIGLGFEALLLSVRESRGRHR